MRKRGPADLQDAPQKLIAMLRDDPELATTRLGYDQNKGWVLNW